MRALILAAVLLGACSSSSPDRRPDGTPLANANTTGRQHVKGGESFTLRGPVTVTVNRVLYENQPCPADVQCITSGVVKAVQVNVARQGGAAESASVSPGMDRVVAGVQVRVLDVQPGPSAEIEASLPLGAGG